jgi:hypothetical protein
MGSTVALGDAEIGQQERHWLGAHRAAPIGVDRGLTLRDRLLADRLGDEPLGEEALSAPATIQPGT